MNLPSHFDIQMFLEKKYVQRADARQRKLGLQYMEAEIHDLSICLEDFIKKFVNDREE